MKAIQRIFLLFFLLFTQAFAQKIYYFKIEGEIAEPTRVMVDSALAEAKRKKVDYVIMEINTPGGLVSAADHINQQILDYPIPVWAFINNNAYSAGALIAIACDSIYMAEGANMGAVTPVDAEGKYAPEKYRAAIRAKMRASAEANRRNPKIAEAMVDETLEYDSLVAPGKLIVYTTSEAIKNGYCEGKFNSVEEILKHYKMEKAQIIRYTPTFIDKLIGFFLNPVIRTLLILLIIGGIYFELQTPGVGFPLIAALVGLALYFVPHYIQGLAQNWELLLFLGGLGLIALEIFVMPGAKVFLIAGLIIMFGALGLMMIGNVGFSLEGVSQKSLYESLITTSIGLLGTIVMIVILAPKIATSKQFKHIALQTTLDRKEGYVSATMPPMIGKQGTAYTVLRPSGKVLIDNHTYDAFTQGDFIEQGTPIEVIAQEGAELVVKRI
ncbi:MAG: NfeD family protein [Raineya sp.]|nr:nodulation protein NfeD [Raineya sp.]MDW8296180.1 NfeD family protein [Raineya sp.]